MFLSFYVKTRAEPGAKALAFSAVTLQEHLSPLSQQFSWFLFLSSNTLVKIVISKFQPKHLVEYLAFWVGAPTLKSALSCTFCRQPLVTAVMKSLVISQASCFWKTHVCASYIEQMLIIPVFLPLILSLFKSIFETTCLYFDVFLFQKIFHYAFLWPLPLCLLLLFSTGVPVFQLEPNDSNHPLSDKHINMFKYCSNYSSDWIVIQGSLWHADDIPSKIKSNNISNLATLPLIGLALLNQNTNQSSLDNALGFLSQQIRQICRHVFYKHHL